MLPGFRTDIIGDPTSVSWLLFPSAGSGGEDQIALVGGLGLHQREHCPLTSDANENSPATDSYSLPDWAQVSSILPATICCWRFAIGEVSGQTGDAGAGMKATQRRHRRDSVRLAQVVFVEYLSVGVHVFGGA